MPDILRLTGLATKLHYFPDQLSGGEQQRVAVARAFVNHPPLLLADEPTGNLDPETSVGIMQLLYRINRTGTTVLVATHDATMVDRMRRRVIELARRAAIIRDEHDAGYAPRDVNTAEFGALLREPAPKPRRRRHRRHRRRSSREARLLRQGGVPLDLAQRHPVLRRDGLGARHRARPRRVHPGRAGDDRRRQRGARPRAGRRLPQDATPRRQDVERVQARSQHRHAHVGKVEYVSKAQAYAQEKQRNPEAYELLGTNPLPDTFRVTPDKPDDVAQAARRAGARPAPPAAARADRPGDRQVKNRKDETAKILTATRVVKLAMGGLAVLLVIASVLLISNTIRLSLFSRRREVEVMKLVGATDSFIRWPFVIEGVVLGALGGIAGGADARRRQGRVPGPAGVGLRADRGAPDDRLRAAGGAAAGASVAVSAAGSGLSLRKFLRV